MAADREKCGQCIVFWQRFQPIRRESAKHFRSFSGDVFAVDGKDLRIRQGIAKAIEVQKFPDDVFVTTNFDQLRILRTGVAVVDENVPAGKT